MGNIGHILCCEQNEITENLINENLNDTKADNNSKKLLPYLSMGSINSKNIPRKNQLFLYSHDNDDIKSIFIEDVIHSSSAIIKKKLFLEIIIF